MDKSAIEQIQKLDATKQAQDAINAALGHECTVIAMPHDFNIANIEKHALGRNRYRSQMKSRCYDDFVAYCEKNDAAGAQCFVDKNRMGSKTFFNLGDDLNPGHGDFTAELTLTRTAEFQNLLEINGEKRSQKGLAEWMEDFAEFISPYATGGETIKVSRAISGIRRLTIESSRKEDHQAGDLKSSRSSIENIEAKSDQGLPSGFLFKCTPYTSLKERVFDLRLSILTGGDKPSITCRIKRLDAEEEEMGAEFSGNLQTAFIDLHIETYQGNLTL